MPDFVPAFWGVTNWPKMVHLVVSQLTQNKKNKNNNLWNHEFSAGNWFCCKSWKNSYYFWVVKIKTLIGHICVFLVQIKCFLQVKRRVVFLLVVVFLLFMLIGCCSFVVFVVVVVVVVVVLLFCCGFSCCLSLFFFLFLFNLVFFVFVYAQPIVAFVVAVAHLSLAFFVGGVVLAFVLALL